MISPYLLSAQWNGLSSIKKYRYLFSRVETDVVSTSSRRRPGSPGPRALYVEQAAAQSNKIPDHVRDDDQR